MSSCVFQMFFVPLYEIAQLKKRLSKYENPETNSG